MRVEEYGEVYENGVGIFMFVVKDRYMVDSVD